LLDHFAQRVAAEKIQPIPRPGGAFRQFQKMDVPTRYTRAEDAVGDEVNQGHDN
jgi:hypothetical protein